MWIDDFIKSGTKQSSMRLTLIWAMILISIVIIAIVIYIIKTEKIDWIGISVVITSLGAFITPFLYFKKEQTKIENVQ
jgi:membrane protein YdbS with pleckstrin-like domain